MKLGVWSFFVFILTLAIMLLLNIPPITMLIIACPILIIVLVMFSFLYNFRDSLHMQPVPRSGYSSRINELEAHGREVEFLGFQKFDEFYLKTIPDSITYAFKHKSEPVYLCLYHLGKKVTCDFFSRYENNFSLTTCNVVEAGTTPRPEKALLQIFPNQSYNDIMNQHLRSNQFLMSKGLRQYNMADFRHYFMQTMREQGKHMSKSPFWPVLLVFRVITQHGRKYCRSIIDQHAQGQTRIYHT